jgi:hypothetical protein
VHKKNDSDKQELEDRKSPTKKRTFPKSSGAAGAIFSVDRQYYPLR